MDGNQSDEYLLDILPYVSGTEYKLLAAILFLGFKTKKELSKVSGISQVTVRKILPRLVGKKFLLSNGEQYSINYFKEL